MVDELIKSALLQVSLQVICLVINDSLDRTLLVDFFLIEYQVTLYIDSLCTNWSLKEVICGEFDISKHLGFDFIRKLLDDRYTPYSRRVYNCACLDCDLISKSIFIEVAVVNLQIFKY